MNDKGGAQVHGAVNDQVNDHDSMRLPLTALPRYVCWRDDQVPADKAAARGDWVTSRRHRALNNSNPLI